MMVRNLAIVLALLVGGSGLAAAERVTIVWPTPNSAAAQRKPIEAFIQHAGSGEAESGCFGCVRSNGYQFHEGLDIQASARDRRGEPTDPVFAAMDGIVRHINARVGDSNYGRYIVIEHPDVTPAVYTLYAHLSRIAPGLAANERVHCGQTIGTMGRSAGGYAIPKERGHLHFEIGLWITRNFQRWYDFRKFGSPNEHGVFNGMNLMGIDALDFFRRHWAGRVDNFRQYFSGLQTAVRVRMATTRVPDFVERYPSLLTKPRPPIVSGWEIRFDWTGLPFSWTPLDAAEVAGLRPDEPVLIEVSADLERRKNCKTLAVSKRDAWVIGKDLEMVMQQLFGLR